MFEADFDARHIVASPRTDVKGKSTGAWDIEKLQEGRLLMGVGKDPLNMVFDATPRRVIVEFASRHAYRTPMSRSTTLRSSCRRTLSPDRPGPFGYNTLTGHARHA